MVVVIVCVLVAVCIAVGVYVYWKNKRKGLTVWAGLLGVPVSAFVDGAVVQELACLFSVVWVAGLSTYLKALKAARGSPC